MFFACLITRVWDKLSTTVYPIYKWNQLASDMIVHTQTSIGSLGSVGDNSITASSRKKFPDQLESKNPLEKAPVESMENGKVLDNPWKSWISMEKKNTFEQRLWPSTPVWCVATLCCTSNCYVARCRAAPASWLCQDWEYPAGSELARDGSCIRG